MGDKIILDLCGGTGGWVRPYVEAGYKVITITLPEHNVSDWWVSDGCIRFRKNVAKMDGMTYTEVPIDHIYGILAAPPCTKFSRAAANIPKKDRDFRAGMTTVRACLDVIWTIQEHKHATLTFWALENPDGYLSQFLGRPSYSFQPWRFGCVDFRATKRTMLWGYFNQPRETVRKRDFTKIPLKGQHSKRKDGYANSPVDQRWKGLSAEKRAETEPSFAKSFYEANK